ncbi:hypothetical protein ACJIZ3_016164 [Penstemon smallii]|uniref:Uncharacterized protein n=1 Tax=Penstemon smallii TaxID=265156 RepID=A0ABD3RSF3_9LAMI
MGGKGIRRREKNYQAAHGGGHTQRLPPPPNHSSIDTIPSKLRQLMSLKGQEFKSGKRGNTVEKENPSGEGSNSTTTTTGTKRKGNDQNAMADNMAHGDQNEKKKKKRKRNKADDLRFESKEGSGAVGNRRKEHRKQRLEAKKNKNKKDKSEADLGFRGHEEIKFGDVVQAPPKLLAVPKAFKTIQDASKERLRLQAVESYRARKKWASRPGVQLPPPVTSSSSSLF